MSEGETSREKNFTKTLIPMSLFKKINEWIKDTGFTSVSSYVTYVLREILTEKKESFTKEDEEKIKRV